MEAPWLREALLQGIKSTKGTTPLPTAPPAVIHLQDPFEGVSTLFLILPPPTRMTTTDVGVLTLPDGIKQLVESPPLVRHRKSSLLGKATQSHHFFISHKD